MISLPCVPVHTISVGQVWSTMVETIEVESIGFDDELPTLKCVYCAC